MQRGLFALNVADAALMNTAKLAATLKQEGSSLCQEALITTVCRGLVSDCGFCYVCHSSWNINAAPASCFAPCAGFSVADLSSSSLCYDGSDPLMPKGVCAKAVAEPQRAKEGSQLSLGVFPDNWLIWVVVGALLVSAPRIVPLLAQTVVGALFWLVQAGSCALLGLCSPLVSLMSGRARRPRPRFARAGG